MKILLLILIKFTLFFLTNQQGKTNEIIKKE